MTPRQAAEYWIQVQDTPYQDWIEILDTSHSRTGYRYRIHHIVGLDIGIGNIIAVPVLETGTGYFISGLDIGTDTSKQDWIQIHDTSRSRTGYRYRIPHSSTGYR